MRTSILEGLRRLGGLSLASVLAIQSAGCTKAPPPPERVFETKQDVINACATMTSTTLVLADGTTRDYFLVPQQDGSVYLSATETAPDGTETTGGKILTPDDVPAYTAVEELDGSVVYEMEGGNAIRVSAHYDPSSGETVVEVTDADSAAELFTFLGQGFGMPSSPSNGPPGVEPQWFFLYVIVPILVGGGLWMGHTALHLAAIASCNAHLGVLITTCGQACAQYGNGLSHLVGRCDDNGKIVMDPPQGGTLDGSIQVGVGCYCLGSGAATNPPGPADEDEEEGPEDLDPDLGLDAAGNCIPKKAAPAGAQGIGR